MVMAMDNVLRESSGKVDSLRADVSSAEEPALPKLAASWARLQAHVATSFKNSVATCGSTVSHKTAVVTEEIDKGVLHSAQAASEGIGYVVATADATKSQINATHQEVVRKVAETTEAGMTKLATARAETMRKVEETQSSITETYTHAKDRTTVMCMPAPAAKADANTELTEDQVEQLKEAFSVFDKSGTGKVTAGDLGMVMEDCGEAVTEDEIKEMIKDVSVDGTINFEEFKAIMARLAAEDAGLPLSKRIAKVPLKMRAQWKASIRHAARQAQSAAERAQAAADAADRAAAEKVKEAEASAYVALEKSKQATIDAKQSTVGWLDGALASVIDIIVPPPPPKVVVPTLGNVGDMDDTENAYVY